MHWDPIINQKASLLARYLRGELTEEDAVALSTWLEEKPGNHELLKELEQSKETSLAFLDSIDTPKAWEHVRARLSPAEKEFRFSVYFKFAVAATILVASTYVFYPALFRSSGNAPSIISKSAVSDLPPGKEKALLTLDNGSVLVLEDLPEGEVLEENGVTINKQNDLLRYAASSVGEEGTMAFNTVSTPIGGFYSLLLPDSSRVWLNAASSIRFPLRFDQQHREVSLVGEAFFEITKKVNKNGDRVPFKVTTERGEIEVLGTAFNASVYPGTPDFKTTLIEGKVSVRDIGKEQKVLRPGQQAIIGRSFTVAEVNTDEVAAWKNGYFYFENKPLAEILLVLKRWYGFEMEVESIPPNKHFTVSISRDKSLSSVLRMLEMSGELHFEIKDKKIQIRQTKR